MQLCYRGNIYSPTRDRFSLADSVKTAKFMGNTYTIRRSQTNQTIEPILYQYRGVSYIKPSTL